MPEPMTTPAGPPPEAVTAAAAAIHDVDCTDTRCSGSALGHCYKLARAALEAAAQSSAPVWMTPDLSEAEVEELRAKFRAAQRGGKITILPDDTEGRIAEAAAAERERCAQIAEEHDAVYRADCSNRRCPDAPYRGLGRPVEPHSHPFASLLRQGGEGGGTDG